MEKSRVLYRVISEKKEHGVEFGIVCEADGREYQTIRNISTDRKMVEELSMKFNFYGLSPNQFLDCVEDALI